MLPTANLLYHVVRGYSGWWGISVHGITSKSFVSPLHGSVYQMLYYYTAIYECIGVYLHQR